jgi:protein-L-isoaspartate(D-aspartate) O-methyltransferase
MPTSETKPAEAPSLRAALVQTVRDRAPQTTSPVAAALAAVPRHAFLPGVALAQAYADEAIVTKRDDGGVPISSSSQPTIMAMMLDQLAVTPGQRVLEIGAGTGYNAALLAHLVGPTATVVSIDIEPDVVAAARTHLAGAGYPGVEVLCADGADGHATGAPYDRIIATVGVWELAPAWLEQLAPDGRIVVPLDIGGAQISVAFERAGDGWHSRSVVPCGFMRLRGPSAGPESTTTLDAGTRLTLTLPHGGSAPDLLPALAAPPARRATGVQLQQRDIFGGPALWLAVSDPRCCSLWQTVADGTRTWLPDPPIRFGDTVLTAGLLDGASLATLTVRDGDDLGVAGFGPAAGRIADELVAHVRSWAAAGRPKAEDITLAVVPAGGQAPPGTVLHKRHSRIVLAFSGAGG